MRILNEKLLNAVNVANPATSGVMDVRHLYCFALQIVATGTPSGTLTIQGSNDDVEPAVNQQAPTNWATIGTPTSLSAGNTMVNLDGQGYAFLRVVNAGGGTGTLTVLFNGKGA